MKDPTYTGGPKTGILVSPNLESLDQQQILEEEFTNRLVSDQVVAFGVSTVLPPIRSYDSSERAQILARSNIDAILNITIADIVRATVEVPSKRTTQTVQDTTKDGQPIGSPKTVTTTERGFVRSIITDVVYRADLADPQTYDVIWRGEIRLDLRKEQREEFDVRTTAATAARSFVSALREDALLR